MREVIISRFKLVKDMDHYGHLFPSYDHKAAMDAIAEELMGY